MLSITFLIALQIIFILAMARYDEGICLNSNYTIEITATEDIFDPEVYLTLQGPEFDYENEDMPIISVRINEFFIYFRKHFPRRVKIPSWIFFNVDKNHLPNSFTITGQHYSLSLRDSDLKFISDLPSVIFAISFQKRNQMFAIDYFDSISRGEIIAFAPIEIRMENYKWENFLSLTKDDDISLAIEVFLNKFNISHSRDNTEFLFSQLSTSIEERGIKVIRLQNALNNQIAKAEKIKIILGNGDQTIDDNIWIPTTPLELNLLSTATFNLLVNRVDNFLAEHVFEHIEIKDLYTAARNCFQSLKPGGVLRIAVPDSNIVFSQFQDIEKQIIDGHFVSFNCHSLSNLLNSVGFKVKLLEYHDSWGLLHKYDWSLDNGKVFRTTKFDKRGAVSLLIDAMKPFDEQVISQEIFDVEIQVNITQSYLDFEIIYSVNDDDQFQFICSYIQSASSNIDDENFKYNHCQTSGRLNNIECGSYFFVSQRFDSFYLPYGNKVKKYFQILNKNNYCINQEISLPVEERKTFPMCYFTLVFNGMPFLTYHINIFNELKAKYGIDWEWHIVEGLASKRSNREAPYSHEEFFNDLHRNYLSNDGTSEYIDSLRQSFPLNVFIHRPQFYKSTPVWIDKIEMNNIALQHLNKSCLLVQLDVDEMWNADQLFKANQLFVKNQDKKCAYFHCHYYITPSLMTISRGVYSHNDEIEWLRMFQYNPGDFFISHAPPSLLSHRSRDHSWMVLNGHKACFSQDETEKEGLVFTHYSYVKDSQVKFKESFYGYENAYSQWKYLSSLSIEKDTLYHVGDYLKWVPKGTLATHFQSSKIFSAIPINTFDYNTNPNISSTYFHLVIDGVVFQRDSFMRRGISRLWREILPILARKVKEIDIRNQITILNRLPAIDAASGLPSCKLWSGCDWEVTYLNIPPYIEGSNDDQEMLTSITQRLRATYFMSTLFTFVRSSSVKNIVLVHDMIPELFHWNDEASKLKKLAIENAFAFITISDVSRTDLLNFVNIADRKIQVAHNSCSNVFSHHHSRLEIDSFLSKYTIDEKYVVVVGSRLGYKGIITLYEAFKQDKFLRESLQLVIIGGDKMMKEEKDYLFGINYVRIEFLSDIELSIAYSGAIALVYLSLYEGFGLPVLEAMKCGCPVLSLKIPAILEYAHNAPIYINYVDENQKFLGADWRDISKQILNLLDSNSGYFFSVSRRSLKRGEEYQYTWADFVDNMLKIIV